MIDIILITLWVTNRRRASRSMGAENEKYAFRATLFGVLELVNLGVSALFVAAYLKGGGR
ncbi:hypothetical protein [Kitasatospora sp. NPDC101183]|uniref:hypothetical protein n=1 Tax=Kitasatospora sp. NPDC101183 TaxID=3364100 RepID=UPI0038261D70